MNKPHAPRLPFAERVAELRRELTEDGYPASLLIGFGEILAAMSEQRAALEGVIRVADCATYEFDAARAVLAKYALEKS